MKQLIGFVIAYLKKWTTMDPPQWHTGPLLACAAFLSTEAAEVLEAVLRMEPEYVRNAPRQTGKEDLARELADVVFMAIVTAYVADIDLDRAVFAKLEEMDEIRERNVREVQSDTT